MAKVRIKELDSLFVLRHAQRADKLAATVSTIDFDYSHNCLPEIHDTFNPPLATFSSTQNKSNNGYTQSKELGSKILNYVQNHVDSGVVVLRFHCSPYLRCIQTVKFMLDYIVRHHDGAKEIRVLLSIDHVLSEWLSTELDVNAYPPNDNGATLMNTAVQYLHSNIPFNQNDRVKILLNLSETYKHGKPGPFSETFAHQYARLNRGVISILKDAQNSLTLGQDTKDIVLLMTHGACVRSIISKLTGKTLMVEIPLASATLAKPQGMDGRRYMWKLTETDISFRDSAEFKAVDLYSTRDPFQDFQTTFTHSMSSQLNFKSGIPASKTENFNRIRSQSLLTPRVSNNSDSDDDSDDEGISFNVNPTRRSHSSHNDSQAARRFRSSSLFGPVLNNPFFEDQRSSKSRKNSFERVKASLRREEEFISPTENRHVTAIGSPYKLSRASSSARITPVASSTNLMSLATPVPSNMITPVPSTTNVKQWQNIDEDDGIIQHTPEQIPDLAELSSNNSSSNSLHDQNTHQEQQPEIHAPTPLPGHVIAPPEVETKTSSSVSLATIKPSGTPLFDKSLIEESLQAHHEATHAAEPVKTGWMQFKDREASKPENKFKIDLYGKKNRGYKLSLYDDDDDEEGTSGGTWFLGSNRY